MNERGAITFGPIVGAIVIVLAIIGLFAVCNDNDDPNGLGRVQLVNHERDRCYDDCGEGGDYQGGPSGGRYEGGRGGSDYDGDGDGNRCRNFCVYPVQPPNEGGRL